MSTPLAPTAPKPRRRWLRPTLGVMMIVVLVVGGSLGWLARSARKQSMAITAIQKNGGVVRYDWQFRAGKALRDGQPRGPKWLRDALGPDVFNEVVYAALRGFSMDDALMEQLGNLDRLELLDLQTDHASRITSTGAAHLLQLTHLQKLTIHVPDATDFLIGLGSQAKLRELMIPMARPTDVDMVRIGQLGSLEKLMVDGSHLTQAGFDRLGRLGSLRELDLLGCSTSDLSALSSLYHLERLILRRPPDQHQGNSRTSLAPLGGLAALRTIALRGFPLAADGLEPIRGLEELAVVTIDASNLSETNLAWIATRPKLKFLGLDRLKGPDLAPLAPILPRLTGLSLTQSTLTDQNLHPVAFAPNLVSLDLSGAPLTDAGLSFLVGLTGLRTLTLCDVPLSDLGLSQLRPLIHLERLNLDGTAITDAGLASLASMPRLQRLGLAKTAITDAGLTSLTGLTRLKELHLNGTAITDAGLATLARLPTLRFIDLLDTPTTPGGRDRLRKARPRLVFLGVKSNNP